MTNHPPHARRSTAWRRSAAAVAGLAAAAGVLLASGPTAFAASDRTDAGHVAEAAADAIEAYSRWEQTADPIDLVDYLDRRVAASTIAADELGVDSYEMNLAWSRASLTEQRAVLSAISQLGAPYRRLGDEPESGFDCSGLTSWAYAEAGREIPRTSGGQIGDATRLDDDELFAGALVHYPGHVGLYVGAGLFVHSPYTGSTVEITTLPERSLSFGDLH